MKISGFTIVRNALKYDYPIIEAITSILPLCDEVVVAVGKSEDDTLGLINSINSPKIRIIETVWDDTLREGGQVLAVETNKAFDAIAADSDWAFYIQGDEVLHEQYHDIIRNALHFYIDKNEVEGLLFGYTHFYGSYDYIGISRRWYSQEIRIIRNDKNIRSYRDAQGFRKNGRKLQVAAIPAKIFHYGWVKHPSLQQAKQRNFHKMWHDDAWMAEKIPDVNEFDYSNIDLLKKFEGTHPAVMQKRIAAMNWQFSFDPTKASWTLKSRLLYWWEKFSGKRPFEYRNFKLIYKK